MDVLDNFANIGKAVLTQALGLQKNYSEIVEESVSVIDHTNPACANCRNCALLKSFNQASDIYKAAETACNNCPSRTFTTKNITKKVYHNEKARYGYKPRLKSNAIKLLLSLHFFHPDRFGIVTDININELAGLLSCDVKTIKNNLAILEQYGYISYSKTSAHCINLCINDLQQYYLPANKGGRGFIVLSFNLLNELLSINSLLSLRIHLRQIMEIDSLNAKGPFTAVSKTYKEIKLSLPDYCKPCVIRKAISNNSGIFDISFKDVEKSVRFEINERFNSRMQKTECLNTYTAMFKEFLIDFNNTVSYINVNNDVCSKYREFFDQNTPNNSYRLLTLRELDLEDLAQLALQYSYNLVLKALSDIYKSYILKERTINNIGGLLRTVIVSSINSDTNTSTAA